MTQPRSIPEGILSCLNNTGSTIAAHLFVKRDTTGADEIALPGAVTDDMLGVTMASSADNEYVDVQTRGVAICTAGGSITQGDRLMPTTAGKVVTWSASAGNNAAVCGTASSDASSNDLLEVVLAGPSVSRQG